MVFNVTSDQAKRQAIVAATTSGMVILMSALGVSGLLQRLPVIGGVGLVAGVGGLTFIASFGTGLLLDNYL